MTGDQVGVQDDNALAAAIAHLAGQVLLNTRNRLMLEGVEGKELGNAGDADAQATIASALRAARPDDAVLSEEAKDDASRVSARRVWIVDPLDGTREYSEGRADWAVHVALWEDGELVTGAVAIPGEDVVLRSDQAQPPVGAVGDAIKIAVSRSRPPAIVDAVAADLGAELVPMGSAGVKIASVIRGICDAYVHGGGQYEWDSAAPVAIARAAGLHTSRLDGSPLVYNREDPYLPDLVVARPEVADAVLAAIARADA